MWQILGPIKKKENQIYRYPGTGTYLVNENATTNHPIQQNSLLSCKEIKSGSEHYQDKNDVQVTCQICRRSG